MNYYEVLGIDQSADAMDIKKAYRRKSLELHPDRNPSKAARYAYDMVREAYECLSNSTKRAAYDLQLKQPKSSYDDLKDFFYRHEKERDINRAKSAKHFSATISLEESFTGCRRFIPGAGKYVNIPSGCIDGSKLKVGDISIRVSIADHPKFQLEKNNLYTKVYIDAIQAMVGIDLYINHPNGEKIKTKVLPGTQEGQKLRLSGKGIDNHAYGQGDLYIFCHIVVPELTQHQRDSIMYLLNSSSAEI